MQVTEDQAAVLLAAAALAVLVLLAAAAELARAGASAEQAVTRADVAAWEISRLLQEARDITRQAAGERKELP